jgi:hypothetical protein
MVEDVDTQNGLTAALLGSINPREEFAAILVEDSTCAVRPNSLGSSRALAATTGLRPKTALSVKRRQQFLRFQAK